MSDRLIIQIRCPKQRLSGRLKELRAIKGWSQEGTAKYAGITRSAYGSYEEGRAFPMLHVLAKLAKTFGVSIDYLMQRETDGEHYSAQ